MRRAARRWSRGSGVAVAVWFGLAGTGCGSVPDREGAPGVVRCEALLAEMDRRVMEAGVADGGPRPVDGHAHLRLTRWLAAVRPDAGDEEAFAAWAGRARDLDREARDLEMRNLGLEPGAGEAAQACADVLLASTLARRQRREALAAVASVPDDYSLARRALGLYPLTSMGMLAGVGLLREEIEKDFGVPLEALPVRGRLVRFSPADGLPAAPAREDMAADALGLPAPAPPVLLRLFQRHAPVFEVDVVRPDDRVGTLALDPEGEPVVDTAQPTVYRRTSFMRLDGRMLLQLEYWAWFASRPAAGTLDILAGKLDGLVWRVTLDEHGEALIYDSIHPCGCYHLVFPTPRLRSRTPPARHEEPLLVPQTVSGGVAVTVSSAVSGHPPGGEQRLVIRVAQGSHYIQRVYRDAARDGVRYATQPYDRLRSLPLPGAGHRSLFAADGIIPASARPERWLLWISGVASPGAMRQAGRHATAFVGRRHFDDADLLARFFTRQGP